MPTLLELVQRTQTLNASKWHWDIHHFAECLDITVEEANGFIKCVENGGKGNKTDGTWEANPAPFNAKVNLKEQRDNILNFHCTDNGRKSAITDKITAPSTTAIKQSSIFVRLGRVHNQKK